MKCYVVRDLLPSYIDGLVSDETKKDVGEHLENCVDCRTLCEQMKTPIVPEAVNTDGKEINFLKKIKKRTIRNIVLIITALVIGFGVLAWIFAIGTVVKSGDVLANTEFQYNTVYIDNIPKLTKEWVIHFELTNGKALKADTEYLFGTDENGLKSVKGCIITLYEVQPSRLIIENNNYTFGYSYSGDEPPATDQIITVRYKDQKVVYSMKDEGLYEQIE
ncbi:MAG: zf-HC2 domain-containing protein [Oscillospiraceae bacterium]